MFGISSLADALSYPPPVLIPGSLRRWGLPADSHVPGQLTVPTSALITDTLALDGVNLAPSADDLAQVSVGYGPSVDPWRYNCTLVPGLCSSRTLVCTTSPGGAGQLLRLVVSVGQQVHRGTDAYSYPELPVLERVSGCAVTDANATRGCPTEGGVNLTLLGHVCVCVHKSACVRACAHGCLLACERR